MEAYKLKATHTRRVKYVLVDIHANIRELIEYVNDQWIWGQVPGGFYLDQPIDYEITLPQWEQLVKYVYNTKVQGEQTPDILLEQIWGKGNL